MYDFIRGPMVWISLLVFVLGSIYQIIRFIQMSRKMQLQNNNPTIVEKPNPYEKTSRGIILHTIAKLRQTIIGTSPVTVVVTTIFHFCLIITPIFLLGHNELMDVSLGFGLGSFAENTSDILTIIFLACALYFLLRRIFYARVRAISSFYDYLILCLSVAPFLTGFLAYHQIFDYKTIMVIHIVCGELMLICIPFTKLVHMIFFFINRIFLVSEYSLGTGNRTW